jgi:LacI family transcriptional regulator
MVPEPREGSGLGAESRLARPVAREASRRAGAVRKRERGRTVNRRVTLKDVAEYAGVSRATASLVVRDSGQLADVTRERVRAAMLALGYVYHRGAASLRATHTKTVGLVVPEISNPFTAEYVMGAEEEFGERDVVVLVSNAFESRARQQTVVRSLLEQQVDGLIITPALGSDPSFISYLATTGIPVVISIRPVDDPTLPYVGTDNFRGGELAGAHLAAHGARTIIYMCGLAGLTPRADRAAGVAQGLANAPGRARIVKDISGPATGRFGYEATLELLRKGALPDAIVCHNDTVAFGIYRALRDHAPRYVDTLRVIGFDNVDEAALWEPPLTTLTVNGREVGRLAANALARRIFEPDGAPERVLLTPELVVRRSCGHELSEPYMESHPT